MKEAGLTDTLKGKGPFTVFAPTDDAFKKMDAKALADLRADKSKLADLLKGHYIAGSTPLSASELREKREVQSAQGTNVLSEFPDAFPAGYRERFAAHSAVVDMQHLLSLSGERKLVMSFYQPLASSE